MKVSDTESSITSRDVVACHRISVSSTDVVVRMVDRKYVEKTLDNRMQINHCSKDDLGLPPNTGKIYLNVHLTSYFSKLAFYCRKLKKNRFIHEISTMRGKLRIKLKTQSEDSSWHNIGHINDLRVIFGDDLNSKME